MSPPAGFAQAATEWANRPPSAREPAWLRDRRRAAADRFLTRGLPTGSDEAWRFTPLEALKRLAFERLAAASETGWLERILEALDAPGAGAPPRWVIHDGQMMAQPTEPPPGVVALPLLDALGEYEDLLREHLGETGAGLTATPSPLADLNLATSSTVLVILIEEAAALDAPLEVVFATSRHDSPSASHPRLLVLARPQSSATLLVTYLGEDGATYFTNAVTEVGLGEGATLGHVRVQREAADAVHLATEHVRSGRGAQYRSWALSAGATLSRLDLGVALCAQGAGCTLDGLYLAGGRQIIDHRTNAEHLRPRTSSRQRYHGIVGGHARAVFDGRVRVHPDAQHIDAHQENRNLLLSSDARVHAKPSLEIEADDVTCSHAATVGELDEAALYYLRTRGIDAERAARMLTRAFARTVTDSLPGDVRDIAEALVAPRFPTRTATAEVG